jgi:hypothetical protein
MWASKAELLSIQLHASDNNRFQIPYDILMKTTVRFINKKYDTLTVTYAVFFGILRAEYKEHTLLQQRK